MFWTSGLKAQEAQSTVELKAGSVEACYNTSDSYIATITAKDFIAMKSFDLTLNYDRSEFGVKSVTPVDALGGSFSYSVDAVNGKICIKWTRATAVTLGDNSYTKLFDVAFNVLNFPNNLGDNQFDSPLTWDVAASKFYYGENQTGSYSVSTTAFSNGALNVTVSYPGIEYTVIPATCNGGQATIKITSPVGTGLQYYFNGNVTPSNSPVATAEAPSINTVRIKDASGCYSHLFSIPVTAPDPFVFSAATTEPAKCNGENGEIQFSISGGTGPYTYWVVPAAEYNTFQTTLVNQGGDTSKPYFNAYKYSTFQVLKPADTYNVAATDANGCVVLTNANNWKIVTITQPSAIVIPDFTAIVDNTCNGGKQGSIDVSSAITGGAGGPYKASINGIDWVTVVGTSAPEFSGLAAGKYTVVVKDINGCTASKVANVAEPAAIAFTTSFTDASCGDGTGTLGSITVSNVTGGVGQLQFVVATAGNAMPASGWVAAPGTINNLTSGYYSIWVKDANGCVKEFVNPDGTGNILPIQKPGQLSFTTNADDADDVKCNGTDFLLAVTAAGGKSPYTYAFDNGSYSATATYTVVNPTSNTSVKVDVKDANGCIATKTVVVNVPALLAIASFDQILSPTCKGGTDGRATVIAVGGTTPYQYSNDNITWYTNKVLALPEGKTTVYVKDANGCTASSTVDAGTLTPFALDAAPQGLIACNGDDKTQGIVITNLTNQAGRTWQYFYASSSDVVYTSGVVFIPASVNGVLPVAPVVSTKFGAGTYYVGARDQYGCTTAVKKVVFDQNPALQLTSVTSTNATCSSLLDGSLTINTLGGNGKPQYAIVNNILAIANLKPADFQYVETYTVSTDGKIKTGKQVVQAGRGIYYVVLRDLCITDNSIFAGPFNVDGYKPIMLAATNPIVKTDYTCHDTKDGTITVSGVSGGKPEFDGVGLYTYKLYTAANVLKETNTTGKFTSVLEGSYYVTVTDASNCPLAKTATVTIVNPAPLVITKVAVTHFSCATSNDGTVAITAAGGTGAYWLAVNASANGTGSDIKDSDWIAFPTGSPLTKTYVATSAGDYVFYVKDAKGCLAISPKITVVAPKVLTPVVAANTPVSCNGGNDGKVDIDATGGFESSSFTHTYSYSLKADFSSANTDGIFTGLAAGNYTVYVKATNTPAPVGNYTYPMIACSYKLNFEVSQPDAYSYKASVVDVACKDGNNGSLTVNVLGGKAVSTANGNEYYVQLTTTANPTLVNANWKLTTGKTYTFTGLSHAIYSVWISNKNDGTGCIIPPNSGIETPADGIFHKVASWEVNEPQVALAASVTFNNNVTCYGGSDGKYTINATGGSGPYKYASKISTWPVLQLAPDPSSSEWKDSNVFDNATAATWVIWVKDANGCIVGGEGTIQAPILAYRVIIGQPQQVKFNDPVGIDALCFGGATGKVTVSGIVSDAGAPYTFNISGKDAAGNNVNLDYSALTAVGGVYTLANVPASVTKHVEPTPAHTAENGYTVKVTDKNGCSNTKTVVVWQNPEVKVAIVKADGAFVCPTDNNGVIEARATGGTNWNSTAPNSYLYQLSRDGVVHTAWQSVPSFIVQVGHTWKIEVKDGNGCIASDEQIINAPVGVTASISETTCYSDTKASAVIHATGEAGRTFAVRYRLNTDAYPATWTPFTSANDITVKDLTFANNIETQNFYHFQVKDNQGCMYEFSKSFVATQHPLEVTVDQDEDGLSASVTITGGVSPYSYKLGSGELVNLPANGNTFQVVSLQVPTNELTVYDAHGCSVGKTCNVDPLTVSAPQPVNNLENKFNVELTFNRDVTIPEEGITVTGGTAVVTGANPGKVFKVAITADDQSEVKVVLANTIEDAAHNALSAKTYTYNVGDHVAPTVVVTDPVTPAATVFTVGLAFNEPVAGVANAITVTGGKLEDVTGSGKDYVVKVSAKEQTSVSIVLGNTIKDVSSNANAFAGQTLTYKTGDFTAPTLVTKTPTLDVTLTDNHPTFKMTFNEDVKLGAGGSLKVYKVATTTAVLEIPVTAAMISGKVVTVDYTNAPQCLERSARYYVKVDGSALADVAGNAFAGVSDITAWTFKTGADWKTPNMDQLTSEFKVYPNPFSDFVMVANASQLSKIVVTNMAGQIVKEVVNPTDKIQLDELRSGHYFISMYNMDNVIIKTSKIVKR